MVVNDGNLVNKNVLVKDDTFDFYGRILEVLPDGKLSVKSNGTGIVWTVSSKSCQLHNN